MQIFVIKKLVYGRDSKDRTKSRAPRVLIASRNASLIIMKYHIKDSIKRTPT